MELNKIVEYKTSLSACFDIAANETRSIAPHTCMRVGTGLRIVTSEACEVLTILPRSGMSLKGLNVIIGTVDADYRGEIMVLVNNITDSIIEVKAGDRIAQGMLHSFARPLDSRVSETMRGEGGFGSTGI